MNLSQYEINYKPPTNTIWTPLPFTTNTTAVIDNITPGLYSYRVRGMNSMLAWGPWATIDGTLTGKEGLPPDVNVFIVTPQQDGTRTFSWLMNNPPIDLAGYKIRYSDVDTSTWPDMVELFSGLMVASPYETNQLPAGDYIFGIIAVDTTGNESANPNYCTITLPNPRLSDVWASSVAQSGVWPGTKTNCSIAADGTLVANESVSGDTWDTMPATWDTTYQWLNPAGTIGYGVPAIDLGASLTFTPMVYSIGVGTIVNQMATSSDGTTWSSFGAIVRATARYVKFLVTAEATLPIIASLHSVAVYIVIKPITEEINDLNTSTLSGVHHISAGDIRLPLVNTYLVIKQVSLTLQNVGPGWTWELIDKNLTNGPRVKIYNASGVLADAVIDAYIKGA
jgi:hypothetical protein